MIARKQKTMTIETLTRDKETASKYNPLGYLSSANLTDKQVDLLYDLDNFQAPYLEEKLISEGKFKNSKEYNKAFTEFKKYVGLTQIADKKGISMLSKDVDKVWHQFLLFTPQYHEFCNKTLGGYLHHVPNTSVTPINPKGKNNFIDSYKKIFGKIHKTWGLKNSADCDTIFCAPPPCCDETPPCGD